MHLLQPELELKEKPLHQRLTLRKLLLVRELLLAAASTRKSSTPKRKRKRRNKNSRWSVIT